MFRDGRGAPTDVDADGNTLLHRALKYHEPNFDYSKSVATHRQYSLAMEELVMGLVAAGVPVGEMGRHGETASFILMEKILYLERPHEVPLYKGLRKGLISHPNSICQFEEDLQHIFSKQTVWYEAFEGLSAFLYRLFQYDHDLAKELENLGCQASALLDIPSIYETYMAMKNASVSIPNSLDFSYFNPESGPISFFSQLVAPNAFAANLIYDAGFRSDTGNIDFNKRYAYHILQDSVDLLLWVTSKGVTTSQINLHTFMHNTSWYNSQPLPPDDSFHHASKLLDKFWDIYLSRSGQDHDECPLLRRPLRPGPRRLQTRCRKLEAGGTERRSRLLVAGMGLVGADVRSLFAVRAVAVDSLGRMLLFRFVPADDAAAAVGPGGQTEGGMVLFIPVGGSR
ncbi:uncharacterized protein BKCO1_18000146 [Diplodia corticola]|uniref:Uncharacterized protein n=1 Tax=Diplodia corticola TaxID=236234 RepID=A0A1J9S3W7_9PEZI|nr:uncharacterized protein BKCO1_18000146 [Diplodia corticola]OJD35239.1 hypothetical protein BKCO1_18000146 [Diplodia corticola]